MIVGYVVRKSFCAARFWALFLARLCSSTDTMLVVMSAVVPWSATKAWVEHADRGSTEEEVEAEGLCPRSIRARHGSGYISESIEGFVGDACCSYIASVHLARADCCLERFKPRTIKRQHGKGTPLVMAPYRAEADGGLVRAFVRKTGTAGGVGRGCGPGYEE